MKKKEDKEWYDDLKDQKKVILIPVELLSKEAKKATLLMFEQIIEFELRYKSINLQRAEDTNKANFYIDEVTNNLFSMFLSGYCFRKHICKSEE